MTYPEEDQVQEVFNDSPEVLRRAIAQRDALAQWQAQQLKKLETQLKARCTASMNLTWSIDAAQPYKKQSHFSLAFPSNDGVFMRVEWFWGYAKESDLYWGVYAPTLGLEESKSLSAALRKYLELSNTAMPLQEQAEAGWPLWTLIGEDPLFAAQDRTLNAGADVVHPWLSVDRDRGNDFVSLILQRYELLNTCLLQIT
ncbi:hypothetical protein [Comamonas kerstersii]|uniref:hypothetical protein n=1 Tax=Comamonas kerstersii TaxID=225992 RepID=UPI0026DD6D4B|nr:hypothetical protein [Comamonas kerstersii]